MGLYLDGWVLSLADECLWLKWPCKANVGDCCAPTNTGANLIDVLLFTAIMTILFVCAQQALITVSNHVASLDDPLLTSALVPAGALLQPQALRWTLCATDRCFTSKAATAFFRAAKVSAGSMLTLQQSKGL